MGCEQVISVNNLEVSLILDREKCFQVFLRWFRVNIIWINDIWIPCKQDQMSSYEVVFIAKNVNDFLRI